MSTITLDIEDVRRLLSLASSRGRVRLVGDEARREAALDTEAVVRVARAVEEPDVHAASRLAAAVEALKRYGRHDELGSCGSESFETDGPYTCNCGFNAAISAAEGREPEPRASFACPECGPGVAVDEDGCCVHCGRDAEDRA